MNDHKILDAIDQANPTRTRSPLARWMFENHDAFAARLSAWRTDWTLLAQVFVEAGLTDADGKPPNSVIARKTWQRVRRMVRNRQMQPPASLAAPPETQLLPTQPLPQTETTTAPFVKASQALPPTRFGTATLRGHTPSAPAPPRAPIPVPAPDPGRADRVIAELLAGQVKGRFAPKIDDGE
jgi:hypothetical protein